MRVSDIDRESRGNSSDHVRRHNLSTVLRLVGGQQGVSRSQLTRITGLNRSTIGALVGELVDLQLVVESDPDARNQVGRPSPIVRPNPRTVSITVNPEVDAIEAAVVGLGGRVILRRRHALDRAPTVGQAVSIITGLVAELQGELTDGHRVIAIGVAVPGLVRTSDGMVRLAPHLGWHDEPLAELLAAATGLRVYASNDAHLGARAESTFGAGRGLRNLIYLNGGASGIGGGIVESGSLVGGVSGYAGEFGHTLVNSAGITCHCGASGCLETEVRRERLLSIVGLANADADQLESALLKAAAGASGIADPVLEEVRRQLDFLAITLRNAINMLNPEAIILGGFLGSLYAVQPEHLDNLLATLPLEASREGVRIVRSELGADILTIGAAELAFASLLRDPASIGTFATI